MFYPTFLKFVSFFPCKTSWDFVNHRPKIIEHFTLCIGKLSLNYGRSKVLFVSLHLDVLMRHCQCHFKSLVHLFVPLSLCFSTFSILFWKFLVGWYHVLITIFLTSSRLFWRDVLLGVLSRWFGVSDTCFLLDSFGRIVVVFSKIVSTPFTDHWIWFCPTFYSCKIRHPFVHFSVSYLVFNPISLL